MISQAHNQVKKFVAGTLLIATGVLTSVTLNALPVKAQMIGGGGTCTPHEVFYKQYIPGYYNWFGTWVASHYETRSRMSTECNNPGNPPINTNITGAWRTNNQNSNALTFITQNGPSAYIVKNEFGSTSSAYLAGDRIYAPQWRVNGQIEANNQLIVWSNGTTWNRNPSF